MTLKYILLVSVEITGNDQRMLNKAYQDAYTVVKEYMIENYPDREIELKSLMSLGRKPHGDTYRYYCRLSVGIDE